jgi:transposase-like protein
MMKKLEESRRWSMMSLPQEKRKRVLLKRRRKMDKIEKPKMEDNKRKRKSSDHTAQEKCRAVLSVWTERRKPGEICRELGVAWSILNHWQERAMEGMLLALQPRIALTEKPVALSSRLAVLLERKSRRGGMKGLEKRLARLQGSPVKPGERQETMPENKV